MEVKSETLELERRLDNLHAIETVLNTEKRFIDEDLHKLAIEMYTTLEKEGIKVRLPIMSTTPSINNSKIIFNTCYRTINYILFNDAVERDVYDILDQTEEILRNTPVGLDKIYNKKQISALRVLKSINAFAAYLE